MATQKNVIDTVVGFINRDATTFSVGQPSDQVVASMNMAIQWAQRTHRFEKCEVQGKVTLAQSTGGLISAITSDEIQSIVVRSIKRAFLDTSAGLVPISVKTREEQVRMLQRNVEGLALDDAPGVVSPSIDEIFLVQQGNRLFLWPWDATLLGSTTKDVYLDCTYWVPDFIAGGSHDGDTNIFTLNCFDWLVYRTLFHLHFFMKDDQREPLNAEVIKDSWDAVLKWDSSFVEGSIPIE